MIYKMLILKLLLIVSCWIDHAALLGIPKITEMSIVKPPAIVGNSVLTLLCKATGEGPIKVRWMFKGKTATENNFFESAKDAEGTSTLRVFDVSLEHSGIYTCTAENRFGKVFNEKEVVVYKKGKFSPPHSREDPVKTIQATVGVPLTIECPPHEEGIGYKIVWGSLPLGGNPLLWLTGVTPLKNAYFGNHGEFHVQALTADLIKLIQDLGGVSCILYLDNAVVSNQINIDIGSQDINKAPVDNPPKMGRKLPANTNATVGKDRQVDLTCGADGYPYPKITWYKDGVSIEVLNEKKDSNFTVTGNGMILRINPVTSRAAGKYKCVAENFLGKEENEGTLTVNSVPKFVKGQELQIRYDVIHDQKLVLSCRGEGTPSVSYQWYHNGSIVTNNERYKLDGGDLIIKSAGFDHIGLYMCLIRNFVGLDVQPTYVIVEATPPTLIKGMDDPKYIFKGEDQELKCSFRSAPAPSVTWQKDGRDISSANTGSLILKSVSDESSGRYNCTATNVEGSAASIAQVIAVVKTKITNAPATLKTKVGTKMLELYCNAVYETQLLDVKFQWLRKGKPFESNDRVYLERRLEGPKRVLFLTDIEMSDAGEYKCRVFTHVKGDEGNIISEDVKTGSVAVIGKPPSPSNLAFSGNCSDTDSDIEITWEQRNNFGQSISTYIIEYGDRNADENEWFKYKGNMVISEDKLSIPVKNLPGSTDLKFRLTAVTYYESETFKSDSVVIVPDSCSTPAGAPAAWVATGLRTNNKKAGQLAVEWDEPADIYKKGPNFCVEVTYQKLPDGEIKTVCIKDGNNFVLEDAGEGEKYAISVRGKNDEGSGPETKEVLTSGAPAITGKPENLQVKYDANITFSWDKVQHATKYNFYYQQDASSRRRRRRRDTSSETKVTVTNNQTVLIPKDLASQTSYSFYVKAANDWMEGDASETQTFQTKPSAPNTPSNADVDIIGHAVQVKWDPPKRSKPEVTGYVIRYKKKGSGTYFVKECDADCRDMFLTDLEPFAYYTVELQAKSSAGLGDPIVFNGLVVSSPDKPGKPAPPPYVNENATIINVNFMLPEEGYVGGLPDNFTIFYYPKDDQSDVKSISADFPNKENLTIEGITSGVYILYAVGENALGRSAPSGKTERTYVAPTMVPVPAHTDEDKAFYEELWFLILIIIILLILLIAIIICCCLNRRGGKYPVDAKEKERGGWDDNVPLKDYASEPPSDNGPVSNGKPPVRSASQNSLKKPLTDDMDDDDDKDSLDDYGEDSKFNEDGSFIGQYGDEEKIKSKDKNGTTKV
ncbi:fibronectin type III domain-containing protein-like [Clytia hemisphaerica]|uniref:Neuroglian n=1 Tax=Clytia hemisphaerica TaxID=252671 RepID=A0A7M5XK74_9CNID